MGSTSALIDRLKEAEQDFEFYPTTAEIIEAVASDLKEIEYETYEDEEDSELAPALRRFARAHGGIRRFKHESLLDIGAGNGKVLRALQDALRDPGNLRRAFGELYAIEKSPILCEELDDDIRIVGTDLFEQSLLSKQVDVTFCNPPYSEFERWAVKIIREAASPLVYLVIPDRWCSSPKITDAINYRGANCTIVGEFDFLRAEDRPARAHVHVLRVELANDKDDAFDRFFADQFGDLKAKFSDEPKREDDEAPKADFSHLVVGPSYPEAMVNLYIAEMEHIQKSYRALSQLDADLLREFDMSPKRVMDGLKQRLAGLKNVYWEELFGRLGSITDRLTSSKRTPAARNPAASRTRRLHAREHSRGGCINRISGCFSWDRWRYTEEKPSHYALEYRIVTHRVGGIGKHSWEHGLRESACEFIGDMLTIANNLGFSCETNDKRIDHLRGEWTSGKREEFMWRRPHKVGDRVAWGANSRRTITDRAKLKDGCWQYNLEGEWVHERAMPGDVLLEVRAFQNGNLHLRLNQKFALALNVEYGRLRGWLHTPQEAAEELGDPAAAACFNSYVKLGVGSVPLLAAPEETMPIAANL